MLWDSLQQPRLQPQACYSVGFEDCRNEGVRRVQIHYYEGIRPQNYKQVMVFGPYILNSQLSGPSEKKGLQTQGEHGMDRGDSCAYAAEELELEIPSEERRQFHGLPSYPPSTIIRNSLFIFYSNII